MSNILIALSLVLSAAVGQAVGGAKDAECGIIGAGSGENLKFYMGRKKNETGHWTTTIAAIKDHMEIKEGMDLEMVHKVIDCEGRKVFSVRGVFQENPTEIRGIDGHLIEKLKFHKKGGKNIHFVNEYRTAFRMNDGENNGVVFTSDHLKHNQLVEVQINRGVTKFAYGIGIGITTNDPSQFAIPDHMNTLKAGTWMYYDQRLFNNGSLIVKDIGRNIDLLLPGDQLGIMIKDPGVLHIFINGNDMGPGIDKIPPDVYGVIELRGKTVQVSIIEKHAKLLSLTDT